MIRSVLKTAVEMGATLSGATALARLLRPRRVAVLAYHNVVADDDAGRGDASLHMPLSRFLEQVDHVARTHQVVELEAAFADDGSRRPRAVITFDDAYRGAVTRAFPALRDRGLPATVFVAPGLLGEDGLWWDQLGEAGRLTPETRDHAMTACQGRLARVGKWAFSGPDAPPPRLPGDYGVATEDELREHAGAHVTVGAHAWAHACLPTLDGDALRDDLSRTLGWVRAWSGPAVEWLALPYGEGTPAVAALALDLGYRGVLEIRGGLAVRPVNPASVPRINVPAGLSRRGLELRTSGLRS